MKHIIMAFSAWLLMISLVTAQQQYSKEDIEQVVKNTRFTNDEGFSFFNKNRTMINSVMGDRYAEFFLMLWIYQTDIGPVIEGKDAQPEWKKMEKKIIKQHGELGEEIVWKSKYTYYLNKKDIPSFVNSIDPYIRKYADRFFVFEINNYAWKIFQEVSDKKLLLKAVDWSKISIDREKPVSPAYYDTYANLLYKTGQMEKALAAEQDAINAASDEEKPAFQEVLNKMKKGEKTWP